MIEDAVFFLFQSVGRDISLLAIEVYVIRLKYPLSPICLSMFFRIVVGGGDDVGITGQGNKLSRETAPLLSKSIISHTRVQYHDNT